METQLGLGGMRGVMQEKTHLRLEATWKTFALIGMIAAAGFNAAIWVGGVQKRNDAAKQHEKIQDAHQAAVDKLAAAINKHDKELQNARYVAARIEIAQQHILEQLEAREMRESTPRSYRERLVQQRKLRVLQQRIDRREKALKQSYAEYPIVPQAGALPAGDPLEGLVEDNK